MMQPYSTAVLGAAATSTAVDLEAQDQQQHPKSQYAPGAGGAAAGPAGPWLTVDEGGNGGTTNHSSLMGGSNNDSGFLAAPHHASTTYMAPPVSSAGNSRGHRLHAGSGSGGTSPALTIVPVRMNGSMDSFTPAGGSARSPSRVRSPESAVLNQSSRFDHSPLSPGSLFITPATPAATQHQQVQQQQQLQQQQNFLVALAAAGGEGQRADAGGPDAVLRLHPDSSDAASSSSSSSAPVVWAQPGVLPGSATPAAAATATAAAASAPNAGADLEVTPM
jgi:hypothetical protein